MIGKKRIYLDYASLTPVDPRVIREMKKFSAAEYANPSSLYKEGVSAKHALEEGRKGVADFLHAHPDEIVFTGGGTEANWLAIEGAGIAAYLRLADDTGKSGSASVPRPHLIISAIEHSSVMEAANEAEKHGVEVTRLSVDQNGQVSLAELKKALKPTTYMVSIMTVNNEIGAVEPVKEIAKILRQFRSGISEDGLSLGSPYPLLHTDAAQAALYFDLNVEKLGVDLLTLDGGKTYGPRGVGALFIRRGAPMKPTSHGGGQERGLRSGTENLPGIMGLAKSLEIAADERDEEAERVATLKDEFLSGLLKITGHNKNDGKSVISPAAPNILNVSIPGIDNEMFLLRLDAKGVACSTKSSCLRDADESYVLKAVGAESKSSIRFSFGRFTGKADIRKALKIIEKVLFLA